MKRRGAVIGGIRRCNRVGLVSLAWECKSEGLLCWGMCFFGRLVWVKEAGVRG